MFLIKRRVDGKTPFKYRILKEGCDRQSVSILFMYFMIIATRYKVIESKERGVFIIKNQDAPRCPVCGDFLIGYDHRRRSVIDMGGSTTVFFLRRLRCSRCSKIHLEIPDIMLPHKHYRAEVVESPSFEQCPADDSTIRRWRKK